MILLLLLGLPLAGIGVALLARAVVNPSVRADAPVAQIERYGFTRSRSKKERPKADVGGLVDRAAEGVGQRFAGKSPRADEIRRQLVSAGMYNVTANRFFGYRILATVGLPLIWIWFSFTTHVSPILGFVGTAICVFLGWWAPLRIVQDRAKRRLNEIDYELPELIDLLVVTVEAGLGFVGSLQMASDRLTGPLGNELRLTLQEQNMGLSINEALANTMARCDTPSMRSFVRSIVQGETLGVSIGQIMRDLATEMRRRRKASAEERAQKAPIKILFPLVFLIFPAMFIVLLGPAMAQFLHAIRGINH
jgi:tight adherence protein C